VQATAAGRAGLPTRRGPASVGRRPSADATTSGGTGHPGYRLGSMLEGALDMSRGHDASRRAALHRNYASRMSLGPRAFFVDAKQLSFASDEKRWIVGHASVG
jgi:hypothetical protein